MANLSLALFVFVLFVSFVISNTHPHMRMKRHGRGGLGFRAGLAQSKLAQEMTEEQREEKKKENSDIGIAIGKGAAWGILGGPPGVIAGAVAGMLKGRITYDLNKALNVTR